MQIISLPLANASNGQYVEPQVGVNHTGSPSSSSATYLSYTFSVSQSGSYALYGRVQAAGDPDDSFWVRMNGGSWIKWNGIAWSSSFIWDQVHDNNNGNQPVSFFLNSGSNTLEIAIREDGTKLDKLYFTLSGGPPSGMGSMAGNCGGGGNNPPVASFTASPTSGSAPLAVNFDASASTDSDGSNSGNNGPAAGSTINTGSSSATINVSAPGVSSFSWTLEGGSGSYNHTVLNNGSTVNLSGLGSINLRVDWVENCMSFSRSLVFFNAGSFYSVYPNPSTDRFMISGNTNELLYTVSDEGNIISQEPQITGVKVFDFQGNEVIEGIQTNAFELDLSAQLSGLYYLQIQNNDLLINFTLQKL